MGSAPLDQAIVPTKVENLSVLPAGGIAPNPSELLAHAQFVEIVQKLKEQYDRIVIDSSPVLAVRDPLLLAKSVDACCLIVRAGRSPSKASVQAVRLLAEAETPASGIVLNSVRHGNSAYYAYAYRTYGTYGAKGVYGEAVAPADPSA
jgi:capsular exopolysaccharide synthesis family protein